MNTPIQQAWLKIHTGDLPTITPTENWLRYIRGDYDTLVGLEKDPRLYARMVWYGWVVGPNSNGRAFHPNPSGMPPSWEGSDAWKSDLLEAMKSFGYLS